ncbi:SDR family oxidoreductase [Pseudomaricurvus sp.]|uniref:SDR family oxidoreductase n=1 Tax=Pseudomaricurvus sp. TaxID=2004510 RepID=UPI003F6B9EA3
MTSASTTRPLTTVTLLGCGDIGQRLASRLPVDTEIVGIRRSRCEHPRIDYRQADLADADSLRASLPPHSDVIVITMTPSEYSDEGYQQAYVHTLQNLLQVLDAQAPPQLILFVSSSSVYGQQQGEWIDENSITEPRRYAGKRLLEAEQLLNDSAYPTCVVRFSGIYGPGRQRLIQQVRDGKGAPADTQGTLYSNRIHVDDCAGVLAHLMQRQVIEKTSIEPLYLASDCQPSGLGEVKQWLAEQMGYPANHLQPGPEAATRASKRCSNRRLLDSGYHFQYPTYQQGYRQVLDSMEHSE